MDEIPSENTGLVQENLSTELSYTLEEACMYAWTECPFACFCYSLPECAFQYAVYSEDPTYVSTQPILAYRAEVSSEDAVLQQGMSAYKIKKRLTCAPCNGNADKFGYDLDSCCWWTCSPVMFSCLAVMNIIACPLSYCCLPGSSPGVYFGQSKTVNRYVSNWSALAFSKKLSGAMPYFRRHDSYNVYFVLLEKGYVDFDQFSKDIFPPQREQDEDSIAVFGAQAYSVGEILPLGAQKVSGSSVVAFRKSTVNVSQGPRNGETRTYSPVVLNAKSKYYTPLFNELKKAGRNTDALTPEIVAEAMFPLLHKSRSVMS